MELTDLLKKASPELKKEILYSISFISQWEAMALKMNPDGFYLAFSGGKDSQVIYELAKLAKVKFKAYMNLTSIDPPEVIRFIRQNYPDVKLIAPKKSIFTHGIKHGVPSITRRWCCQVLKESAGAGTVTILGIRHEESAKRKKRQEIYYRGKEYNSDQFDQLAESSVSCVRGRDKIKICPIIYWTTSQVWEFIHLVGLKYCKLYDQGYKRIGCILCPMKNYQDKIWESKKYPHVVRNWKKTIKIRNPELTDSELDEKWNHYLEKKIFLIKPIET